MDSFDVDMELLRRLGEIRRAVEELDGSDTSSLRHFLDTIDSVRDRAGEGRPELRRLVDLMASGMEAAPEDQKTPTSRLATGILAAAGAAEQSLFSSSKNEGATLIDQAGATLLLAMGEAPESWTTQAPTATSDTAQAEDPPPWAEESPEERATLDDVAAFMVRMDPEEKGSAVALREMIEEFQEDPSHPEAVSELAREMMAALDAVTLPARTKKSVRREAVEEVERMLEEASLILEEGEAYEIPETQPMETPPSDQIPDEDPGLSGPEEDEAGDSAAEPAALAHEEKTIEMSSQAMDPELTPEDGTPGMPAEAPDAATAQREEPTSKAEATVMDTFPSSEPLPDGADPDLTLDFVTEGFEYLEQAEEALLILEGDPKDKEAVNVVFRAFHTIKGVSGFMELHRISDLAHHAETLLSKVRDDELRYTGVVADLSLRGIDVLKDLLGSVREGVKDGILRLTPDYGPLFTVLADPGLPEKIQAGTVSGMEMEALSETEDPEQDEEADDDGLEAEAGPENPRRTKTSESSVRVRTDRLDQLVDMVGELVIAHSMLAQDPAILMDRGNLNRKVDHSAKILRELQDLSTSLRMVPLKPAFRKVTRVVRDLSKRVGKPVDLITDGEDTEIDRTMVDILADPLVHMVRNSVDHGLETPEERAKTGKTTRGQLRISAYQAGGNVVIEVSDDGRGLDRDRILAKAIERGVVDSDRGMTDSEIYNLIFAPGFSTAEKVTDVSGRGVGMDVVRRNVDSLRGRVSIESKPGEGSTFSIHLPLTLAITDGMVIRVGSQRYIIPSVKIQMSLRPDAKSLSSVSGKGEMVLIQGSLLPVIRLHSLWGIPDAVEDPLNGLLVIVGEGRTRSALLVDELVTQQQFVVKPLSGVVANTQGVAGGAIMGNGDVGLILDPEGIIAKARGIAHVAAA